MTTQLAKPACMCGAERCRAPLGPACLRRTRERLTKLERIVTAKLPSLEICEAVDESVKHYNAALSQHIERVRFLDADLSARYVLIQLLTEKLASAIGPEAAEDFARNALPRAAGQGATTFVRSLGRLEPIFAMISKNELAAERAHAEPDLPEPSRMPPWFTPPEED